MSSLKNLEKLVNIESDKNCDEILEFLKSELLKQSKDCLVIGDDKKIFLAGINTTLKNIEPIVLSGHIDTVGPNFEKYNTNPFELTEIGGKCFGLGSIDMKSFCAVILDNIDKIKQIGVPIVLALTTDEETDLKSVELMIDTFSKLNIKPKFTIIGEPTKSEFNLSSNACYEYSISFFGKSCHSSRINEGINSINACAKMITFIEENQKKYRITSNCGVVKGGDIVNKVPDYAELIFDVRSIYSTDINQFLQDISDYAQKLMKEKVGLNITINKQLEIPAFNMMGNQRIMQIAEDNGININSFTGGCEAGYYTQYSGDAVIFGVGDMSLAHKPNEYVEVDEYNDYSKKFLSVLDSISRKYYNDQQEMN